MCAFLNTGEGGIVYLGVADDGQVKGLFHTVYTVSICRHKEPVHLLTYFTLLIF